MSPSSVTAESFGHDVLGPIIGEFCLRLWSLGSLLERPDGAAMLFCARGGLRMQLAYERFLAASGLPSPVHVAPLLVSRVVAIRPALVHGVDQGLDHLVPAAAATLAYEFRNSTLADTAVAVSGVAPTRRTNWDTPLTPAGFAGLLRHPDGEPVVEALRLQAALFTRHLREVLGARDHAMIVDTGLHGTTRQLLTEGLPAITFSSALIARSFRNGVGRARTFGLSVEATGYSPLRRRTAVLRHWHFLEWLFEPELPSARTFTEVDGAVRSNLEVPGWEQRIAPTPDTAYAGVLAYLDALPKGSAEQVLRDVDRAWDTFRQAVVRPRPDQVEALRVGIRSHDFGTDATWSARPWRGPLDALRGSHMWREGRIAGSGTPLRRPLLAAIEIAYGARLITRVASRRTSVRRPIRWR
jgi:hypothetical protein